MTTSAFPKRDSIAFLLNESAHTPDLGRSLHSRDDAALLDEYSRTVVSAADRVGPAVVNIDIKQRLESQRGPREVGGSGSGFAIAPDGFTFTNSHVVHAANQIAVSLPDVRESPAQSLGTDPAADFAL